ncbi:MAG TPA: hypothetical protein PLS69_08715 [Terricaulis sp.]|nr:hypothetical protein [Terricaulis sp.]
MKSVPRFSILVLGLTFLGCAHPGDSSVSPNSNGPTVFFAAYTHHDGYTLSPPDNINEIIIAGFSNDDALQSVNRFFSTDNLQQHVGKKIYCECAGEWQQRNGQVFYLVREARLFSE